MVISKIVVIAMGLGAVVPHGDNDGATILLRDALQSTPEARLADGTLCPVGSHVPVVIQLAGTCDGHCTSFNEPPEQTHGFERALGLGTSRSSIASTEASLFWIPMQESLRFDGIVPKSKPAAHSFRYSFEHGGGAARVDEDCLEDASRCPIIARLIVETGGIKTCTLSQYRSDGKSGNAGFVIEPFGNEGKPTAGPPLAESYAIEIDTIRDGPLVLTATNFLENRILRSARLSPDAKSGEIVLLIANLPSKDHPSHTCGKIQEGTAHSAVVYDLARGDWGPSARVVPRLANRTTDANQPPGNCKRHLRDLESLGLLGTLEYPSNPAKCKPTGILSE